MKIKLAVMAVLLLDLTAEVEAVGATGFAGFPMGNTNVVMDYATSNSFFVSIHIYQNTPVGQVYVGHFNTTGNSLTFRHKSEIDAYFNQKLVAAAQGAVTNNNPWIDRSWPFMIYAVAYRDDADFGGWLNFLGVSSTPFYLAWSNGSYYVPDLSWIQLGLPTEVAYNSPQLSWARLEVTNVVSHTNVVYDPRANASDVYWIDAPHKTVFVPREYALSGTNGSFRVKVNMVSGTNNIFQVFGSMGQPMPENPFWISGLRLLASPQRVKVETDGGEIGRNINVLGASEPNGPWTNILATYTITPYSLGNTNFSSVVTVSRQFYRLQATNMAPSATY